MAIGTPVSLGSTTENSGDTNVALTVGSAVSIGDHVIAYFCEDENRTLSSIADSKGNTWAIDVQVTNTFSGGTTGRCIAICSAKITSALTTSDTITATHSGGGGTVKSLGAFSVSGLDTTAHKDLTSTGTGNNGTAWTTGSTGTLSQADELVVTACSGTINNVTNNPGTWTEILDRFDTDLALAAQYKIVSATTAQTGAGTWSNNVDWAAAIVTYKAAGGGGGGVTVKPLSALGVG